MTDRVRSAEEADHQQIVEAIQTWWTDSRSPEAARELSLLVPRLFLQHFGLSSLVVERDGRMLGFLIGFLSQDRREDAYIHFVGVDPAHRQSGIARRLYAEFFMWAADVGRSTVRCVTSPANVGSIDFHQRMGFDMVTGDEDVDGVPVHRDYDGPGHDRVCFVRDITPGSAR